MSLHVCICWGSFHSEEQGLLLHISALPISDSSLKAAGSQQLSDEFMPLSIYQMFDNSSME